ncbi:hypothetical protein HNR46_003069 [Haloferula luteola]|uniref:DUF3450 family protein n=1 Tax=Haloferula luteola TaxID=595692 RepID=A0A840VJF0_9BACT|nr:DUF3450 family protein [Haloferula luteola]MBB5352821.1 hypothetical protein [Haloferula luteola]
MRSWIALSVGVLPLLAQEKVPDAQVVELRETIAKVVDVKTQASAERSGWETQKAEMSELLGLHRRELELLNEELEKSGTSAGGDDELKTEAEEGISRLKAARREAGEAVARNRERALALAARFPKPLAEDAMLELAALKEWQPGDEPRDGIQAILGLVTKAEQFNRRITRGQEVRDGREVEVLYLGLARAYYADRSGHAGIGIPANGGWKWESRPEIAKEVLKAFDELDRKRPPELVELPVKIES